MDSSNVDPNCKKRRISNDDEERKRHHKDLISAIDESAPKRAHELVQQYGIEGLCPVYLSRLLKCAIEADNEQLVKDLLDKDPKIKTDRSELCREAVSVGAMKVAAMLVRNGAVKHDHSNLLHVLVSNQDPSKHKLAVLMLQHGANPNVKDGAGNSVLHLALQSGSLSLIRALMEKGARVNVKNLCGENVIARAACLSGARKFVDLLLSYQGALLPGDRRMIDEMVMYGGLFANALRSGLIVDAIKALMRKPKVNLDAIKILATTHGFDIKSSNTRGCSLVVQAILEGVQEETIELLLELGSDLTMCNQDGLRHLYNSDIRGNWKKIKYFIKRNIIKMNKSKVFRQSQNRTEHFALQVFYDKCLAEMKYMEIIKLNEQQLPMIKILTSSTNELSWMMRNTNLMDAYENKIRGSARKSCPIYFEDLDAAFIKAIRRKELLYLKEEAFTEKMKKFLPTLVLEKIFFYLYINFSDDV